MPRIEVTFSDLGYCPDPSLDPWDGPSVPVRFEDLLRRCSRKLQSVHVHLRPDVRKYVARLLRYMKLFAAGRIKGSVVELTARALGIPSRTLGDHLLKVHRALTGESVASSQSCLRRRRPRRGRNR